MDEPTHDQSARLWAKLPELQASTAFMLYLAKVGSDRLSLTQAAFFMLAATADAAGRPATRSQLIHTHSVTFRGSIKNSYRQLLEPSGKYQTALGWLRTEPNPDDDREQFLRLTKAGKKVILCVLLALEPIGLQAA